MSRKIVVLLFFVFSPAWSQKPMDTPLYECMLNQARDLLDRREAYVGGLISPASLEIRRDWVQENMIEAFGGLPVRTPLNPRTVWTKDYGDYRVEGVIYDSRPGFPVTANLYIPNKGKPPYPGVLGPCGHSKVAKGAEVYQNCWINLARRGFVVLSFDPIGQGERMSYLNEDGADLFWGTTEHTMLGVQSLLLGYSLAREMIWDGIRSLDYLTGRPEVDPNRIGCTGNSGGGTQTSYFMAVDRRITCAAPSCFLTSLRRLCETIAPQDAEQNLIGQIALGIDHADYVEACLPRPVLICCASNDYFDVDGTWRTFREAKNFFGRYGVPERVDIIEAPDDHGFSEPRRTAVYHWMARWLKGEKDEEPEPETVPPDAKELLCTKTGQVLTSIPESRSLVNLYADEAEALRRVRRFRSDTDKNAGWEEELTRAASIQHPQDVEWEREVPKQKATDLVRYLFTSEVEPGWKLGVKYVQPTIENLLDPVLWLDDILTTDADPRLGTPEGMARKGHPVFVMTPRGLDRANRLEGNGIEKRLGDYRTSFLALLINRPLLGQRVQDILAVLDLIARRNPERGIRVVANREAVPPAIVAAALDQRIQDLILRDGLCSWDSIFETGISHDTLSNIVPGMLKIADLPDLVEAILPRKVTLLTVRGPEGDSLAREEVESEYDAAIAKAAKCDGNPLSILPEKGIE